MQTDAIGSKGSSGDAVELSGRHLWLVWIASFAIWTLITLASSVTLYEFNRLGGMAESFLSTLALEASQGPDLCSADARSVFPRDAVSVTAQELGDGAPYTWRWTFIHYCARYPTWNHLRGLGLENSCLGIHDLGFTCSPLRNPMGFIRNTVLFERRG